MWRVDAHELRLCYNISSPFCQMDNNDAFDGGGDGAGGGDGDGGDGGDGENWL